MATLTVFNAQNEQLRTSELNDGVFGVEDRPHLVHQVVKAQLAARRRGTAKTKERGEITGSTRKLFRQKGRGAARKGSIKSPILVGGGTIFGPEPRDHSFSVPKKARRLALKSALSDRLRQGRILGLDAYPESIKKTRDVIAFLANFGLDDRKVLLVTEGMDGVYSELRRCSKNIPHVKVLAASALNVYDILNHEILMAPAQALEGLEG